MILLNFYTFVHSDIIVTNTQPHPMIPIISSSFKSSNILGVALAAGVGPLAVPYDEKYDDIPAPDSVKEDTQDDLHLYFICECAVGVAFFLLALAYFPQRPPKLPRPTAPQNEHLGFKESWKLILHSRDLWLLCAALAIPGGIQMGWQSVMAILLEDLGVTDTDVGNIGFAACFGQAAGMAAVGFAMDHFRSKIKTTLLILLTISLLSITWLALLTLEWLPYSLTQLYIATVCGVSFYLACMPLFFEMAFMICPSVREDTMGAFLTGAQNMSMLIFLLIMMAPDMDYGWMNYLLIIGNAVAVPLIALVPKPKDYISNNI